MIDSEYKAQDAYLDDIDAISFASRPGGFTVATTSR